MTYPGLFSRFQPKSGSDWIRRLPREEVMVFVNIGLEENGHGQKGGRAVYVQKGREHLSKIGRIGAIKTNSWKAWKKALREELEKEFGVTFDY
jgi:hypothetical protein